MGASENRAKNSKMAADMVKRGIYHGRRTTSAAPHSGGTTRPPGTVGSSKYARLRARIVKASK